MKLKTETGFFLLIIIFAILIALSVAMFFLLQTDEVTTVLENSEEDKRILNILFILEDNKQPLFTDIVLYYPDSERGAIFDIPANTGLISASLDRMDRIDAVYKEKGLAAYKQEIEKLTGIEKIPFTIEMDLKQFSALTDLLGGLKVFILSPIDVTTDDNERYLLPSGAVQLDGDKIVEYVSYRIPEEPDEAVQNRMQNILGAFLYALNKQRDFVLHKDVFPLFYKNITTNLDKDDAHTLFTLISKIDSEKLVPQTVTGTTQKVDGKPLLFPTNDGMLLKEVIQRTVSSIVSGTVSNRVYVLEVKNGTNVNGLARNTSALLKTFGYDVLSFSDADRKDYTQTVIIDHIGDESAVKSLADIINCTNIVTGDFAGEEEGQYDVDFTLILGSDFDGRNVR